MPSNKNPQRRSTPLITRVEIEKLFGRYNYDLKMPGAVNRASSNIAIIYGDNGTGKTTVLKLVFHLLSTARNRGHRTFLARVPFSRLSVAFSDKTKINVAREGSNLTGTYTITLTRPRRSALKVKLKADETDTISPERAPPKLDALLDEMAAWDVSTFFLSDDRTLESDEFPERSEERYLEIRRIYGVEIPSPREIALRESLDRTATWLRRRLIQESSRGEAEAQHFYANIVETIGKRGVTQIKDYKAEKDKLTEELKELDTRSRSFTEFGLISRVNVRRFIKGLEATKPKGLPFVAEVVRSFISGQRARLDALEQLNRRLRRFVDLIDEFLLDKTIQLEVDEGISILSDHRITISPEKLSSGEKQLLLLFCNVLASGESASLFIIDEPELSLNVKWQRSLIDALVDITIGSECQFLFATHSIELIAKHRKQVIKLNPR